MAASELRQWMMSSIKMINKYLENFQTTFEANRTKSWLFFKSLVKTIKSDPENPLDVIIKRPGNFYLFSYESYMYNEGTLPWYDAYPLIIVLNITRKGFLGINFHWIHPMRRALILKKLILSYNVHYFNDERLIGLNYRKFMAMLGGYNKRHVKVAIRQYLWSGLRSIGGLRAARIKNIDMIDSIAMVSPQYVGTTQPDATKWITDNTRSYKGSIVYP